MWRLFFPLRYFRLINAEKRHLDLWPTLILAAVIATPFIVFPQAAFFHTGGFLDKLILLTSALTGFYVAALVAAATFVHDHLDRVITLGEIKLPMSVDGKQAKVSLTRREFACTIFGYLAFSALMLSIFSAIFIPLGDVDRAPLRAIPYVGIVFSASHFIYIRDFFIGMFSLAVAHLAVVTSLGLYYLMDRLYRREPTVTTEKQGKRAA